MPNRGKTVVQWPGILLHGLLFLIFFQLLSDFVEAIYAFGLMGTGIPAEIAFVLFFFSPLLLLVLPGGLRGRSLTAVGLLMLLCRITVPLLDTRGKLVVAGLGVACFLMFFPALLYRKSQEDDHGYSLNAGLGLAIGLTVSILLRTFGSGYDVSTFGWSQVIGCLFAFAAGALIIKSAMQDRPIAQDHGKSGDSDQFSLSAGKAVLCCLGIGSILLLSYFILMSPLMIARWTGADHRLIMAAVTLGLSAFALLMLKTRLLSRLKRGILSVWNVLFVTALTLTILAHQIRFPAVAEAWPLPEPAVTWLHHVPLVFLLLLMPVIPLDFVILVRTLTGGRPSRRSIAAGFSATALYLLLMVFSQVFTTVYDYIPVVGPFFRDRFYLVFLAIGIVLTLSVLFMRQSRPAIPESTGGTSDRSHRIVPVLIALIPVITIAGVFLTTAKPAAPPQAPASLKIITYNIQQGYNADGLRAFDEQLDLLRTVDADIIGLQECDTARIANGNADIVKYFADRLHLYSYYGPKTVTGTFGIALLSKFPIEDPQTVYLYSLGEQTALIKAQITVSGKTWNVFVTHLGNDGPLFQQEGVMEVIVGKENVILMGDFNFRPDTAQYRLTTGVLADSWLRKWPQGNESQGIDPARRIDHIFVSPDILVTESTYLPGPQSDHPAMVAEIEW